MTVGFALAVTTVRKQIGEKFSNSPYLLPNLRVCPQRPPIGVTMQSRAIRYFGANGLQYPAMAVAPPRDYAGTTARGDW